MIEAANFLSRLSKLTTTIMYTTLSNYTRNTESKYVCHSELAVTLRGRIVIWPHAVAAYFRKRSSS